MKKNGFTLIEILVVTSIVGLLSSTLVPKIGNAIEKTNNAVTQVNQNRDYACEELGLDDFCDSSAGGGVDTSDGVHYIGTDITVCRNGECITLQDKNVGATTTGAGVNAPVTSYGNYFQWGNNYGFPNTGYINGNGTYPNCNNGPINNANFITTQQFYGDRCNYYPNDNLRGGGEDINGLIYPVNNPNERQGPCGAGYHVPSKGEAFKLLEIYAGYAVPQNGIFNSSTVSKMFNELYIPLGGLRNGDSGRGRAESEGWGEVGYRWTSSADKDGSRKAADFIGFAPGQTTYSMIGRARGFPVRCFKN